MNKPTGLGQVQHGAALVAAVRFTVHATGIPDGEAAKSIDVTRQEYCGECKGSGAKKGTVATSCNYCGGQGQVVQSRGFFQVATTCPACGGG